VSKINSIRAWHNSLAFSFIVIEGGLNGPPLLSHPIKRYHISTTLNTENGEYITWQCQELNFVLLGGLMIEATAIPRVGFVLFSARRLV
jgi:hypothetical protein